MKKLSIMFVVLALVFTASNAFSAEKKAAKAPAKVKPTVGKVVSLVDYLKGDVSITKDAAVKKAENGNPIVLLVGEGKAAKIYFILTEDGSFGGKKLANYANNKKVGVEGKLSVKNGVNYIIATKIESFD
jgi:hypothetical protein